MHKICRNMQRPTIMPPMLKYAKICKKYAIICKKCRLSSHAGGFADAPRRSGARHNRIASMIVKPCVWTRQDFLPLLKGSKLPFAACFYGMPNSMMKLAQDIREDNRRFWLQNHWPSSWGSAEMRWRVGRASTNTGRIRVGGSRSGPRPARLKKTWYHSGDTDSVRESKRFDCCVNFRPRRVTFFFKWNAIFDGIGQKLLPTKAAPIASLNLSIIHWSLSRSMTRNKSECSESNPVKQQM